GNNHGTDNDAGSFSIMGTGGLNANGSSMSGTGGTSLAGFLVGAASSYSVSVNLLSNLPRNWIHSLYIQDDWKVTPTLTANIGVRWSVESSPTNKYGQQSTFDPTVADNTMAGAMGVILHPKGSMYNKDWNNFQPRIGLAWHARKNLVLRTGWSVNTVDHGATNPPTEEYGTITATWNQPSGEYRPLFLLASGPDASKFSFPPIRADGSIPMSGVNYANRGATMVNPNRPNAYTMNWNFGVQYGLSDNYMLEFTYNGDRSLKGWETWAINTLPYDFAWNMYQTNLTQFNSMVGNSQPFRPWINFGGINYQGFGSNSIFHSGTIKIEKRYSYGLTFMAFYTRGK
ncbi:MAG TPA: TonB-dependent receptor, partial [Candidatus Acidoferrum sp.]|nr:TonB-dependent receptor [Candidatus Acidoferrum sp.]